MKTNSAEKFIELLENGHFHKPMPNCVPDINITGYLGFPPIFYDKETIAQLEETIFLEQEQKQLESYKRFLNTSAYDHIKVKVRSYNGDNNY